MSASSCAQDEATYKRLLDRKTEIDSVIVVGATERQVKEFLDGKGIIYFEENLSDRLQLPRSEPDPTADAVKRLRFLIEEQGDPVVRGGFKYLIDFSRSGIALEIYVDQANTGL